MKTPATPGWIRESSQASTCVGKRATSPGQSKSGWSKVSQTPLSLDTSSPPPGFPRCSKAWYVLPSTYSGFASGSPPSWTHPWGILIRYVNHLNSLFQMQRSSIFIFSELLSNIWAPHMAPKDQPKRPMRGKTQFACVFPQSHAFKLTASRWGWPAENDWWNHWSACQSHSASYPDTEILELLQSGQQFILNPKGVNLLPDWLSSQMGTKQPRPLSLHSWMSIQQFQEMNCKNLSQRKYDAQVRSIKKEPLRRIRLWE